MAQRSRQDRIERTSSSRVCWVGVFRGCYPARFEVFLLLYYISRVGWGKHSIASASQTCFRRGCLDDEGVGTALEFERMFINPITKTRDRDCRPGCGIELELQEVTVALPPRVLFPTRLSPTRTKYRVAVLTSKAVWHRSKLSTLAASSLLGKQHLSFGSES